MFTGAIKLAQIDDYISPGQSCIQPKIMTKLVDDKAGVSLNDCLACSGCVTSAESLLVEQMSIDKFLKVVESQDEIDIMVIIAPQTVLNLARHYNLSPSLVLGTMSAFLRAIPKVRKIFDLKEILPKCHSLV